MESFHRAKTVRLKSHHNKFLTADADEKNVKQHANGSSPAAKWTVEFVDGKPNVIRLRSTKTSNYLASSSDPFLLGMTGKKALQVSPRLKGDARVQWEPVKEGPFVKLRTPRGTFLRANAGSVPPWRNTVTHDIPSRSVSQDWVLWVVDVLDIDHTTAVAAEVVVAEEPGKTSSASSNSGGSPAVSFVSVRTPSPERHEVDSLSRASSTSSNGETPIRLYSQPAEEVSPPYIRKLKNNSSTSSKQSNSFNKLESMIADADKLIKNNPQEDPSPSPHEVQNAKQTLTEATSLDFESMLSSGKLPLVESAISTLLAHESSSGRSRTGNNTKLVNLKNQLEALRVERAKAEEEVEACEEFVVRKAEMKAGLQREVGRARELQRKDVELIDKVEELRRRREELLREMERVEVEIREREEDRVRNEGEIEEVCGEIGRRSDVVKEVEREEEVWERRKEAVERRLRKVEDSWGVFKISLLMFEG